VRWNHSDDSKVSYLRDSLDMFLDLIRIRLRDFAGRYDDSGLDLSKSITQSRESAGE
jgi:hypothetical protein